MANGGSGGARTHSKLQNERVMHDIIGRGLLTLQEIRVSAYVWRFSWGMRGASRTHPNVRVSGVGSISDWCQIPREIASRTLNRMIRRNMIIRHQDRSLEFNEHIDTWLPGGQKCDRIVTLDCDRIVTPTVTESSHPVCPNRHGTVTESSRKCDRIVTPSLSGYADKSSLQRQCQPNTKPQTEVDAEPPPKSGSELDPKLEPERGSERAPQASGDRAPLESTLQRRKHAARSPTAAERVFLDGFKKTYGHEPTLDKQHAIGLATLVGRHGVDVVMEKITAWWSSPAGAWADKRGTRGIGAFLHSFDDIKLNVQYGDNDNDRTSEAKRDPRSDLSRFGPVRERPQPDLSRFD